MSIVAGASIPAAAQITALVSEFDHRQLNLSATFDVPDRRPSVLGPTESQRDLCRIARWCRPYDLLVQQVGDLIRIPGGVCAIQFWALPDDRPQGD